MDAESINQICLKIQKNGELETLEETDGDWGGASLETFIYKGIRGFILYNTEAHTKNLKQPFDEDIYGTLTVKGMFLDNSEISSIGNTSPKYSYDWSWWGDITETIFSLINRDKIWVFKIEGTILKGLKEPYKIKESPQKIKNVLDEI